jgi:hypothetical protein
LSPVVGFDSVDDQQRPAHGADRVLQRLDLPYQIVRHRRTVGLVFRVRFLAKSLAFCIENTGAIIGCDLPMQAPQHVQHAVDRAGGFVLPVAQVRHGVECAVEVRGSVDQQQGFHQSRVE